MKNMTSRYGVLLVALLWSAANQASTISVSGFQDEAKTIISPAIRLEVNLGGNLDLGGYGSSRPEREFSSDAGKIELQGPGAIETRGSIATAQVMPLPSEPTFLAHSTSGMPRIGDNFDIHVWAISSLANASIDEMILGFGFNAELSGTGSAQFLGRSIHPLFTDISAQEGVNLTAAGLAFPGLSGTDAGSLLLMAILHFQALTAGDLNIAISSDLNDLNQGLIYLTQSPLAIQANTRLTITAVPLPPSDILFATAGFLMLKGRRKITE